MKVKRLISFSPSALEWLKGQAEHLDISVSEYVRRMVDEKRKNERKSKARR